MAHILTMIMTSAAVLKGKRSLGGDRVWDGEVENGVQCFWKCDAESVELHPTLGQNLLQVHCSNADHCAQDHNYDDMSFEENRSQQF